MNVATSKTKPFCEVDNNKNEAILRDFLQKWKVDGLVPVRFAIGKPTDLMLQNATPLRKSAP